MSEQLKFIASMFKMCMQEFYNVMGPESIQTIFRLIGERQGATVEQRMRERYNVDSWTPQKFAELIVKDVFDPALGTGNSEVKIEGDEIIIIFKVCPFDRAGIDISSKFFCTYTEGLVETSLAKAFGNIETVKEELKSDGAPECIFRIKIKK